MLAPNQAPHILYFETSLLSAQGKSGKSHTGQKNPYERNRNEEKFVSSWLTIEPLWLRNFIRVQKKKSGKTVVQKKLQHINEFKILR